jgi:hypothetical protein
MSRHQEHQEEDFDDMPMEFDLAEALGGLLTNEEGNNIAGVLTDLNASVKEVAHQLETHNKLMIKVLTAMTPKA